NFGTCGIWKNQVNRFRFNLAEGSVIIIKNFKVAESMGEYRPVQSDFKITFLRITTIQNIKDDTINIPKNGFQFIRPNIVRSRVNNNTYLSDVVGCLCGIGDLESVGSKWKKLDLHILTDPILPVLIPPESGPYIVIIMATTVNEFRGEITFATTAATKTYVNLQMDHISSLIQKFATKPVHIQTIESDNRSNIPIAEAMFQNRMTITELLDSDWSYDIEECFVTLRAQISQIDTYFGWHYISCNLCNKKIEPKDGVYTCNKCGKECDFLLVRYKIHIKVKDNGGKTTLVLFNGVAEKLLDTSASKLLTIQLTSPLMLNMHFKLQEKLKMKEMQNSHVQKAGGSHTNNSEEHPDNGEGTSNGNTRVYARRLIKKRKHFIHLDRESDADT
ncbi:hypothetical protein MTR67_048874, partial [Solanum verrucosum]